MASGRRRGTTAICSSLVDRVNKIAGAALAGGKGAVFGFANADAALDRRVAGPRCSISSPSPMMTAWTDGKTWASGSASISRQPTRREQTGDEQHRSPCSSRLTEQRQALSVAPTFASLLDGA